MSKRTAEETNTEEDTKKQKVEDTAAAQEYVQEQKNAHADLE